MALKLVTLLACVALSSAQVTVPLTDSSLVFRGGYYNQTLCGGVIFLPERGDSLSLNFVGSDIQFEFILNPNADPRRITVEPDGLVLDQQSGGVFGSSLIPPLSCSSRAVYRVSEMIGGQLYYGRHTAAVVSGGFTPVQYDGTGLIVSEVQYYPDPLPGVPTLTSEPSSNGSNKKAIIGGVVGGVLGLGLLVGAIIIFYRRRQSTSRGEVENPQLDLLAAVNLTTPERDGGGFARTPGEKSESAVMVQAATATTTLPQSPQRDFAQAAVPAAQPYESRAWKPLPSPPPTQHTLPNNSNAVEPSPQHSEPQLSPQQARLVQELMDQGVPPTQVAGVVKSMLASGAASKTDTMVAAPSDAPGHAPDAPPQYDFKDASTKRL